MSGVHRLGRPATHAPRHPGHAGSATADRTRPRSRAAAEGSTAGALLAALGLVAVLALALVIGGGRPIEAAPGLPQSGLLVEWGQPVVRLAARIAALATVGALLFAAVLLPGEKRALPAASRRAVRSAARWALAWAATTALSALLTLSELVGVPPALLTATSIWTFVTDLGAGRAAVVVVAVAGVLAVLARRCTRPATAAVLLTVALVGLVVPAVLTGHSAAAENHLLAVVNLSVHVVTAAVWVGGLLALLLYGRHRDDLGPASGRFSAVALICFFATGASGLLAVWLVLGGITGAPGTVTGTGYGWLLAAKTAALVALGAFGQHHRRSTLPALRAGPPGSLRRFAAVEAAVMLTTIALAVALAASPPPALRSPSAPVQPAAQDAPPAPPESDMEDMTGHDHGALSVTVLVDETRFHVSAPVAAGSRVSVHNATTTEVTITASDGTFDVVVPGRTLTTFAAPSEPGSYPFSSRHAQAFTGVLVVH
jgi:putative copper export protein